LEEATPTPPPATPTPVQTPYVIPRTYYNWFAEYQKTIDYEIAFYKNALANPSNVDPDILIEFLKKLSNKFGTLQQGINYGETGPSLKANYGIYNNYNFSQFSGTIKDYDAGTYKHPFLRFALFLNEDVTRELKDFSCLNFAN
jgi:hypothetical protein